MGQNLVPLVNIKIAGKWMFIPLKMVSIGIDPFPFNHHFNQRVNSPLLWGDLGRGHPLISMMHTQCAGQHSRNTRDGIGDTSYIHIHIIYISYYITLYHIISYYIILCIYKSNSLQHVCCTEYLIMYIYNCIYIYTYIRIYSYIYIYTQYMSFWGNILYWFHTYIYI